MIRLLATSVLIAITSASFCGDSTIPFSLEVLQDGQPVLGCARPTCFGWSSPSGEPTSNTAGFYTLNGRPDGFIRPTVEQISKPIFATDGTSARTATCDLSFSSHNCSGIDQWVGGIGPLLNVTQFQTTLICCTAEGLGQSEDRGVATLRAGQIVVGGEVFSSGIQVGFDYVSDMLKVVQTNGSLHYEVSIRRMPCPDVSSTFDKRRIPKPNGAAQAFQASNLPVSEPLPLPQSPGSTDAVLEEIIQEEAIQLAPGTMFEPASNAPPPPPPQQISLQAPPFAPQPAAIPQYYYPPTSYYGAAAEGQFCFTADMTVELSDGSVKRMDELAKKDWVLTVNAEKLQYLPVEFWLHRVPTQEAEFNEFETEDGKTIKLTDKHYIFKGDCSRAGAARVPFYALPSEAVTADQVRVGDCLFTVGSDRMMHEIRVVRARKVTERGIYAPMTSSGRIVVNGVHASCHNIMQAHSVGHSLFKYVERFNEVYEKIFGSDSDGIVETPRGLNAILAMADVILPRNLMTF